MAGFYIGPFPAATDDADWAMTLDLTDDATNAPYNASALDFTVEITDCGQALLTAKTADGSLTRPANNQIFWRFTKDQMGTLCKDKTYKVGCVAQDADGNITQIFVADLPVIDGGLA
jgi:hypothetical protein